MKDTQAVKPPIAVGLVEDDEGIRASLCNILGRNSGCKLLCACPDAETALKALVQHRPEVVLMDINLPKMSGIECVRLLKEQIPATQFIMLTVYGDNERLFQSLMAGASGYLLKTTPSAVLIEAIRDVSAGGSPMTPEIARRVFQFFRDIQPPVLRCEAVDPSREANSRAAFGGLSLQGNRRQPEHQPRHRAHAYPQYLR